MTPKLFSDLGLSPEILKAVDRLGFEQASPIQAEAIPLLLQGHDIVGQSQTGSGKTAAFVIPAIERLDPQLRTVQVLILCPTRELAVQVAEEVQKLVLFKRGVHALPIYGGQSYERQFYGLKQHPQIVIGTPGRVMDHMRRGTLVLDALRIAILDEADVMLNMGFREDIETILQATPASRQTVFFSATVSRPIRELIERFSREPRSVSIEQKARTVPTVNQIYYEVDRRFKIELLARLIDIHDLKLGIIFCNTKRMVDELTDHLEAQGYSADRLHGDMSQVQRDRVMQKFRRSGLEFLVATDVAARGIDVDDVQVVFNYDLPYDPEDYLHRIGRTGRAGRSGRAISFVAGREVFQIRNIERFTNMRIPRGQAPTAGEVEEARANVVVDKLRGVLQRGEFKRQDHLIERLLEEGFSSTDIASALLHQLQSGDGAGVRKEAAEGVQRTERTAGPDRAERPRGAERPERPARPGVGVPVRTALEKRPASAPAVEAPVAVDAEAVPGPAAPAAAPAQPPRAEGIEAPARVKAALAPTPTKRFAAERPPRESGHERPARSKPVERPPLRREASGPPWKRPSPGPARAHTPKTPAGQTRLFMNIGSESGIQPIDIVNAIAGETGLPGKVVGTVDVRERHLFVDVEADHAKAILSRLNRAEIKGRKIKAKVA